MQTVLVSGGAGFIGSHLCKALLDDGYRVICIDNFLTSDKKNVEVLIKDSNFALIEQDVTNPQFKVQSSKFKVDFIFHLASPASPNKKSPRSYINHPIETLLVNSLGTQHLLEITKEHAAKFLYASSSEVYGDPAISPQPETYFGNVNPNGVRAVYDEGKRFGEALTMAYVRTHGLDCRIVRIFNTYGPQMQKDDGRVVSNFITQALANTPITVYGDGTQTRSFCYVDDMVGGVCRAMFTQGTAGEVINLGNPNEQTIAQLAARIKTMTGSSSEIVYEDLPLDDPTRRKPDITKAKKLLNWEPKVVIEEGLTKAIQYFKESL